MANKDFIYDEDDTINIQIKLPQTIDIVSVL